MSQSPTAHSLSAEESEGFLIIQCDALKDERDAAIRLLSKSNGKPIEESRRLVAVEMQEERKR